MIEVERLSNDNLWKIATLDYEKFYKLISKRISKSLDITDVTYFINEWRDSEWFDIDELEAMESNPASAMRKLIRSGDILDVVTEFFEESLDGLEDNPKLFLRRIDEISQRPEFARFLTDMAWIVWARALPQDPDFLRLRPEFKRLIKLNVNDLDMYKF